MQNFAQNYFVVKVCKTRRQTPLAPLCSKDVQCQVVSLPEYLKVCLSAGLPDGLFSNQKIPIWVNFGGP
jgi:hypothetical protein